MDFLLESTVVGTPLPPIDISNACVQAVVGRARPDSFTEFDPTDLVSGAVVAVPKRSAFPHVAMGIPTGLDLPRLSRILYLRAPNDTTVLIPGDESAGTDPFMSPVLASLAHIGPRISLAWDPLGDHLFISDEDYHVVRVLAMDSGLVYIYAGNGTAAYFGDGGPATQACLDSPRGIAVDDANQLYIADSNNCVIRKVDASGIISTFAGAAGQCRVSDTTFTTSLHHVALDFSNRLFADDERGVVLLTNRSLSLLIPLVELSDVSPSGNIFSVWEHGMGMEGGVTLYRYPYTTGESFSSAVRSTYLLNVAVDQNSDVFWVNNLLLLAKSQDGVESPRTIPLIRHFSIPPNALATTIDLIIPNSVQVDAAGAIYFADAFNSLARISLDGRATPIITSDIGALRQLCFGPHGSFFLTESTSHIVWIWFPDGPLLPFAGNSTPGYSGALVSRLPCSRHVFS